MSRAMDDDDPFGLARFTEAQASVYSGVLHELSGSRKRSHWMWFIFPQIAGLGSSAMSRRYAIKSLEEARAYLAHPVLGVRLRECARTVLAVQGRSASEIFGDPDDLKLQSSMTLFAQADGSDSADGPDAVFSLVLAKYFGGQTDAETLRLLAQPLDPADGAVDR